MQSRIQSVVVATHPYPASPESCDSTVLIWTLFLSRGPDRVTVSFWSDSSVNSGDGSGSELDTAIEPSSITGDQLFATCGGVAITL